MKKYIYSIIAMLIITWCPAQMYVSQAEYFWDTDPGAGNGTAVSAADGTFNNAFEQLTKSGIATPGNGLHKLSIRIKDNTGVWGPVFANVINVQQTSGASVMAIAQAEYFWDTDPGVGSGTAVLAADGNFDSSFEQLTKTGITLPANGLHIFNIRIKDNTGVWGPVFKNVINVEGSTSAGCWQIVTAGSSHSLGIKMDGTLWAWGENNLGQLGDGTTTQKTAPNQIGTATDWKKVVAGDQYSIAIKNNGTLWAWGKNSSGELGDATNINRSIPTQIGTATDWSEVNIGVGHTLAIKTNGTLWAWGHNGFGQLGDGTTTSKNTPIQIGTANNWKSIAAGAYFSLATKTNGTLWSWGSNNYGQLGDGTTASKAVPSQIGTDTNWADVAAGYSHGVARKTNWIAFTWGRNHLGQLGDGTNTNRLSPVIMSDGVETIDAGWNYTVGTTTTGNMFAAGDNEYGQLGTSSTTTINWVSISNSSDHKMVSAGSAHTFTIDDDGFLKATGNNAQGRLGDGTTIHKSSFTSIACPTSNLAVQEISAKADPLKVYPNPVQDILNILSEKKILSVAVYSVAGQLVTTKVINDTKGTVDMSTLKSGVYLVKINSTDNVVKTVKVIKR